MPEMARRTSGAMSFSGLSRPSLVEGLADVDHRQTKQLAQDVVRLHLDALRTPLERFVDYLADSYISLATDVA
jgi:hypothetical protein